MLYVYLVSGRTVHSVQRFTPPKRSTIAGPYCSYSPTGTFAVCHLGKCKGAWKPPRSHHCSVCGVCRLDFDHHCPWIGNCVTTRRMKAFLCFLFLIPATFCVAIFPIYDLLWKHILAALTASREDPDCQARWWNWYGSWIYFGGPLGRWIWGTIFGFRILQRTQAGLPRTSLIEGPHLGVTITAGIGLIFSLFSAILGIMTFLYVLRGAASYEGFYPPPLRRGSTRQLYICIPDGSVHPLLPGERVYDVGWKANLRKLAHQPFLPPLVEHNEYIWPEVNPSILRRIRDT
ncbi:hypothetical protein BDN72DRAFT_788105 [Pluteus cervinus]|uniref:Uncharacterized protein n=1 Tax=Pluteus cervinus TaxID=181527 RepID=A0ACD3BBF6_9AGAR|nr:hypothetical protein BDN72DRAFT_788105 [Pluteus cervinus]